MPTDHHESMRHIIDKSFAGEASLSEQHALREHLLACSACQHYASQNSRVIASLAGFSFPVDTDLQAKIFASLAVRAQQLQAAQQHRQRIARTCVLAILLAVVGSFCASYAGAPLAALLHLEPAQTQAGLFALWILPSWGFALLLPVLLLVSVRPARRKGITS